MMTAITPNLETFLGRVGERARDSGVFGEISLLSDRLVCQAKEPAAPAEYRVGLDGDPGVIWVSLVTADRWLSESIETDLLHTGDKLDELIDEELAELGYEGPSPGFQHYRSDDKLFTFRSALPVGIDAAQRGEVAAIELAAVCLLAYEACFRNLGDMQAGDED